MAIGSSKLLIIFILAAALGTACSGTQTASNSAENTSVTHPRATETPAASATPSKSITDADVAKLKWLEGNWRGMDGDKPFYERIRFEGTTMVVETLADGTFEKVSNTSRFELKDGEFGNTVGDQRSAASSIADNAVQFVPGPIRQPDGTVSPVVKGHTFRFEKQSDGTWNAVLETPATNAKPAATKVYKMEPFKPTAAAK